MRFLHKISPLNQCSIMTAFLKSTAGHRQSTLDQLQNRRGHGCCRINGLKEQFLETERKPASQALVNTSHVTNVSIFVSRFHDPGLIECMLTLGRKSRHGAVVRHFDAQIHFIARGKISHRDVLRAKARVRRRFRPRVT